MKTKLLSIQTRLNNNWVKSNSIRIELQITRFYLYLKLSCWSSLFWFYKLNQIDPLKKKKKNNHAHLKSYFNLLIYSIKNGNLWSHCRCPRCLKGKTDCRNMKFVGKSRSKWKTGKTKVWRKREEKDDKRRQGDFCHPPITWRWCVDDGRNSVGLLDIFYGFGASVDPNVDVVLYVGWRKE